MMSNATVELLKSRPAGLLLLGQLLDHIGKVDHFISLNFLRRQLAFVAEEGFAGRAQFWESIIHQLLFAVNIYRPHLLKLINSLLRHSFIEVFLFRAQAASQILINSC